MLVALALGPPLALSGCGWAPLYGEAVSGPASEELRAIYVAPMPTCDTAYAYYVGQYRGVADNDLTQLPTDDFVDYAHATSVGALDTSHLFAEFVSRRRQNWK